MKKTNLRVNNFFVFENNSKYYLSNVDVLEEWNDISLKELKKNNSKEITSQLKYLLKKYKCKSNVNFIEKNFLEEKLTRTETKGGDISPIKVIRLDNLPTSM